MTRLLEESCRARMILKESVFIEEYLKHKAVLEIINELVSLANDPAKVASISEFIANLTTNAF